MFVETVVRNGVRAVNKANLNIWRYDKESHSIPHQMNELAHSLTPSDSMCRAVGVVAKCLASDHRGVCLLGVSSVLRAYVARVRVMVILALGFEGNFAIVVLYVLEYNRLGG